MAYVYLITSIDYDMVGRVDSVHGTFASAQNHLKAYESIRPGVKFSWGKVYWSDGSEMEQEVMYSDSSSSGFIIEREELLNV